MSKSNNKRVLKVYRGHYRTGRQRMYKSHPVIRFGGIYLTHLDFQVGDRIEVLIRRGSIVIIRANAEA